jgi:hypothetical protein
VLTLDASSPDAYTVDDARDVIVAARSGSMPAPCLPLYEVAVLCSRTEFLPSPQNMLKPIEEREADGDATEKGDCLACFFRQIEHLVLHTQGAG